MKLTQAPDQQWLFVKEIQTQKEVTSRLQEMGVVLGAEILVQQRSLWNGPLVLQVGASFLAIRLRDAQQISVEAKS